ncbi:MAG: ATP-binding protein [Gammaproteobacteria bacterium]
MIWHKLFLALLAATAVVVAVALLLTRWSFDRGFLGYLNSIEAQRIEAMAEDLAGLYAETDSWDTLIGDRSRWRRVIRGNSRDGRDLPPHLTQGPNGRPGGPADSPPGGPQEGPADFEESDDGARLPAGIEGSTLRPPPGVEGRRPMPPPGIEGRPPMPPPGLFGVRQPMDLLDADHNVLIGKPTRMDDAQRQPITVDGITVGYLRYRPISALTDLDEETERQFIEQQRAGFYATALVALAIAAALAIVFGRQLVAPIRHLVGGTQALAAGKLDQRISVTSRDELGQLAQDFNAMAESLEQSQRSQRQWIVDIAHELRTPLAILAGELQAAEDGVREWNPQARESLQAEVERLTGLVNDLHELSLSDAGGMGYQWREVDLVGVIKDALDQYNTRIEARGLSLETELPAEPIVLRADARRLQQLLTNLLENSCRYTDAGGRVKLVCTAGDPIHLCIEDTAPGVPEDALPHLFDRLYRVDASRNRAEGGSGLGLAICKGIVLAHGGHIHAELSSLGGLVLRIELLRDHA